MCSLVSPKYFSVQYTLDAMFPYQLQSANGSDIRAIDLVMTINLKARDLIASIAQVRNLAQNGAILAALKSITPLSAASYLTLLTGIPTITPVVPSTVTELQLPITGMHAQESVRDDDNLAWTFSLHRRTPHTTMCEPLSSFHCTLGRPFTDTLLLRSFPCPFLSRNSQ